MICTGLWRLFLVESRNIRYQGAVFGSRFWDRRSEHPGRASLQERGSWKACSRSVCRLQTVGWTGRMDRVVVAGWYEYRCLRLLGGRSCSLLRFVPLPLLWELSLLSIRGDMFGPDVKSLRRWSRGGWV